MSEQSKITPDEKIHALTESLKIFSEALQKILGNDGMEKVVDVIPDSLLEDGRGQEAAFIASVFDDIFDELRDKA